MRRLPRGASGKSDEVIVALVEIRRACFHAKPADDTCIELHEYCDVGTRARKCGELNGVLVWNVPG